MSLFLQWTYEQQNSKPGDRVEIAAAFSDTKAGERGTVVGHDRDGCCCYVTLDKTSCGPSTLLPKSTLRILSALEVLAESL